MQVNFQPELLWAVVVIHFILNLNLRALSGSLDGEARCGAIQHQACTCGFRRFLSCLVRKFDEEEPEVDQEAPESRDHNVHVHKTQQPLSILVWRLRCEV